jgi:tRNA(His) guanylyltransferase
MSKDDLGNRMKGYENVYRTYLEHKVPVLIRVDGRHFHSLKL